MIALIVGFEIRKSKTYKFSDVPSVIINNGIANTAEIISLFFKDFNSRSFFLLFSSGLSRRESIALNPIAFILSEIAENAGITRQGVRDAIKRAEAQLTGMEERLGLVARFENVKAGLGEIMELSEEIAVYNRTHSLSMEINDKTAKINAVGFSRPCGLYRVSGWLRLSLPVLSQRRTVGRYGRGTDDRQRTPGLFGDP